MTVEIFYLTEQLNRWLNLQVAHHLEAQAAKLKSAKGPVLTTNPKALGKLGADGPGGSMGLDCRGMPDCGEAAEAVDVIQDAAAGTRFPAAQMAVCDGEKPTVSA
jgi:hypothetical protein